MSRRIHGSLILGLFALLAAAAPARADTIAVGAVWFQTDSLGTYDFIEILNLSGDPSDGGYAEPPAYPVYTPLSFENATITYVTEDGTENTVLLGTISPGAWIPDDLYFDPSVEFASIAFSAAIYPATFLVGSQPYQATDITASSLLQNGDGSPSSLLGLRRHRRAGGSNGLDSRAAFGAAGGLRFAGWPWRPKKEKIMRLRRQAPRAAFVAVLLAAAAAGATAPTPVTLNNAVGPASGPAGITVSLLGTGFPSGTILAATSW